MAPQSRRERLAHELARARTLAGLSQRRLAPLIGKSYTTVQGVEQASRLPDMNVVRAWLTACGVDELEHARIVDLAEAAHGETRSWGELRRGAPHLQDEARSRESGALRVRNFQPTVVPGLLQTPEYATGLMPLADVEGRFDHEAAVAARLARQRILYDDDRRFEFLMTEQVLRWAPGSRDLLASQLDRIQSLAGLETVALAVLPTDAPVLPAWHNFVIWERGDDPPYVTTELVHGEQEIHDPDQVALYVQLWDRLWASAATGDDAVELIRQEH
jgi:transcriptional regulator with XRE-family HTH domain